MINGQPLKLFTTQVKPLAGGERMQVIFDSFGSVKQNRHGEKYRTVMASLAFSPTRLVLDGRELSCDKEGTVRFLDGDLNPTINLLTEPEMGFLREFSARHGEFWRDRIAFLWRDRARGVGIGTPEPGLEMLAVIQKKYGDPALLMKVAGDSDYQSLSPDEGFYRISARFQVGEGMSQRGHVPDQAIKNTLDQLIAAVAPNGLISTCFDDNCDLVLDAYYDKLDGVTSAALNCAIDDFCINIVQKYALLAIYTPLGRQDILVGNLSDPVASEVASPGLV